MQLRSTLIALVVFSSLPVAAATRASSTSSSAFEDSWRALTATGAVDARPAFVDGEEWNRVVRGDELMPKTSLRTGRNGRATLAQQRQIVIVNPRSELELPSPGATGEMAEVQQRSGRVVYRIQKRDAAHFRVRTPHLVAVVKGTAFLVEVENGRSWVTVNRGLVEVWSEESGERVDVQAGESVVLDPTVKGGLERVGQDADRQTRRHAAKQARDLERELDDVEKTGDETKDDDTRSTADLEGGEDLDRGEETDDPANSVELEVVYDEAEREKIDPGSVDPTDPGTDPGTVDPIDPRQGGGLKLPDLSDPPAA